MMTTVAHYRAEAQRLFKLGVTARDQGETAAARQYFLQAAENLYQAAHHSNGQLKATRTQLAARLVQEAESLQPRQTAAPRRSGQSSPKARVSQPESDSQEWLVSDPPNISFDDVAGLAEVKEQIRLKLLYPFIYPDQADRYKIEPGGGILLYGPPGTGKTMIARAVAGEIEAAFFAIKPSEIMSQWVGKAEQNLAKLFSQANACPVSVIFVDELESLAPRRRTSGSTVMQRVVPQLLAELDGFHKRENALLFIGATNEPWAIDSAILRPGRLDRLIYVAPPDPHARRRILELNLEDIPLAEDVSLDFLAIQTAGFSGADMTALARRVRERVFTESILSEDDRPLYQADFETVLTDMTPSIAPADLRKFEKFAAGSR
jgi:transitional endoplasmic reticulum ATPase